MAAESEATVEPAVADPVAVCASDKTCRGRTAVAVMPAAIFIQERLVIQELERGQSDFMGIAQVREKCSRSHLAWSGATRAQSGVSIENQWNVPRAEFTPILNSYMGENTPKRKDCTMDKLLVPVEV
jgi:hypothetical protein